MKAIEEVCPLCQNTNGEHLPWCPRTTPKEWRTDDKPVEVEDQPAATGKELT